MQKSADHFPHTCKECGAPSYTGDFSTDCSRSGCTNHKGDTIRVLEGEKGTSLLDGFTNEYKMGDPTHNLDHVRQLDKLLKIGTLGGGCLYKQDVPYINAHECQCGTCLVGINSPNDDGKDNFHGSAEEKKAHHLLEDLRGSYKMDDVVAHNPNCHCAACLPIPGVLGVPEKDPNLFHSDGRPVSHHDSKNCSNAPCRGCMKRVDGRWEKSLEPFDAAEAKAIVAEGKAIEEHLGLDDELCKKRIMNLAHGYQPTVTSSFEDVAPTEPLVGQLWHKPDQSVHLWNGEQWGCIIQNPYDQFRLDMKVAFERYMKADGKEIVPHTQYEVKYDYWGGKFDMEQKTTRPMHMYRAEQYNRADFRRPSYVCPRLGCDLKHEHTHPDVTHPVVARAKKFKPGDEVLYMITKDVTKLAIVEERELPDSLKGTNLVFVRYKESGCCSWEKPSDLLHKD